MRVLLAPMEGVINHIMRELLTQNGDIDRCVTEFVRVTDHLLPPRVFYRLCPELHQNSRTGNGTPVYVQLLGSKPGPMADNAVRASKLGAAGIDLNFGCPAKTVNRNEGGSILLREPQRVHQIVKAVREACPSDTPVTVKIRLGYDNADLFQTICDGIFQAGADELVIHARTKMDGYKPPAHWQQIAAVSRYSPIPIIANGEIWSIEDYQDCIEQSLCSDIMLGRDILACPNLAQQIKTHQNQQAHADSLPWLTIIQRLIQQLEHSTNEYPAKYACNPVKQWLGYLRLHYKEAENLLNQIKRIKSPEELMAYLTSQRDMFAADHAA